MATKAQVERTLKELLGKLDGADLGGSSLPGERTLACHIRDLALTYRGTFSEGRIGEMTLDGSSDRADIAITVASDDLIALNDGRLSPVFAMLSGKLRIDAGARDLMLLRQLF